MTNWHSRYLSPMIGQLKNTLHKTGEIQSQIVTITKEEKGRYNVWFRSEGKLRLLCFKMLHVCKLKQGEEKNDKVAACENYDLKNDKNSISNIIYSKTPGPEPNKT